LLVVQDGKSYLKADGLVRTATILDNMIASGALPPTVAVFLEPGRRLHPPVGDPSVGADGAGDIVDDAQRSLESDTISERYGQFLLEDILPCIRQFAPNITNDPRRRALMGVSSGCVPQHCFVQLVRISSRLLPHDHPPAVALPHTTVYV
jgi:enterochelin esterase-like enzyme